MAIKLTTTKQAAVENGVKMTVYGVAGSGKTSLAATFDVPTVILSAEAGLLSLRGVDIPVIEIGTMADVMEAYTFLRDAPDGQQFKAIVIDSITEIGGILLAEEKSKTKDGRAAYGATSEQMMAMLRAFRDIPGRHVLFIAQLEKVKDDLAGAMLYGPGMPGQKLGQSIPYLTDIVMALRLEKDAEGNLVRWLQTQPDSQWSAKDRSGLLDMWEQADLGAIIRKIRGE
jgi:phage nucleotide-binding protein